MTYSILTCYRAGNARPTDCQDLIYKGYAKWSRSAYLYSATFRVNPCFVKTGVFRPSQFLTWYFRMLEYCGRSCHYQCSLNMYRSSFIARVSLQVLSECHCSYTHFITVLMFLGYIIWFGFLYALCFNWVSPVCT